MLCTMNSQELEFLTAVAQGVGVFRTEIKACSVAVGLTNGVGRRRSHTVLVLMPSNYIGWLYRLTLPDLRTR